MEWSGRSPTAVGSRKDEGRGSDHKVLKMLLRRFVIKEGREMG